MKKEKYQLSFLHYFLIGLFLVLSVCMFLHKEVFHFAPEGLPKDACVSYLPKGEYALHLSYEKSPEDNAVILSGDGPMEKEFFTESLPAGNGETVLRFRIEQGIHNVSVTTKKGKGKSLRTMDLQSVGLMNKDNYFLALLFFLGALAVGVLGIFVSPQKQKQPIALFGIALLASIPLFSDAIMYANGQDLFFHMVRIEGISNGLLAGEFPVRINSVQNAGFGNLSATMYPQMFLYPVALLRAMGLSLMLSVKLLMVFINIATAFACFYSVKALTKRNQMGFVATILYTFAPYRLSNLYFRGAIGETLAMVFLPLLIWGTVEVLWRDEKKWPVLAIGMTGVLGSHVLSVEMCALLMVAELIWWLLFGNKKEMGKRIYYGVQSIICSILASATFLIPFFYYCKQDLQAFHMPFRVADSVAYLSQLFAFFIFPEGYNLEPGTTQGEMPLSVGGLLFVGALLYMMLLALRNKDEGKEEQALFHVGNHCMVYACVAILLSSSIFPWETVGKIPALKAIFSSLQFAWRFLSPATALLCVVAAIGYVGIAEKKQAKYIYGVVIACVLVTTGWFFEQVSHNMSQNSDKTYLESLDTADSIYMLAESDEFVEIHSRFHREDATPKTKYSTPAEFTDYVRTGSGMKLKVTPLSEEGDELMLPIYYYPGYELKINGQKTENYSLVGWLTCKMPSEEALVEVKYKGFWFFTVADVVSGLSVITFAVLSILTFVGKKEKRKEKRKEKAK